MITTTEARYIAKTTVPAFGPKKATPTITKTTSRAVQAVNGTSSAVRIRCPATGSTRVAETAGTLQP